MYEHCISKFVKIDRKLDDHNFFYLMRVLYGKSSGFGARNLMTQNVMLSDIWMPVEHLTRKKSEHFHKNVKEIRTHFRNSEYCQRILINQIIIKKKKKIQNRFPFLKQFLLLRANNPYKSSDICKSQKIYVQYVD